jgi:PKD repeat protein
MRAFLVGFILLTGIRTWAQCPVGDFSITSAACINQNLSIQNNSSGAVSYQWDFCSGDLTLTPTAEIAANNTFLFRTRSIRIVKNSGNWYGFTIDQANSPYKLIRFNFGASLQNTPSITNLGNPSGLLNSSYDLQMYKEDGNWYALVANSGADNILKLSFGANLDNAPTIQNLGSFGELKVPNGIFLIYDNGLLSAFITNETNVGVAQITRLDFGSSINNVPVATSFPISGGSTLRGISIVRECDRWFGIVASYGNAKVFWIDFNNGLYQPPQSGEITFFTSYNYPAGVSVVRDGAEYFAFIQSALGQLYKLSFGSSIIDKMGSGQTLGNLGVSNENFAIELIKEESDWIGFSMDLTNRRLVRYNFPTICDAIPPVYNGQIPPLVQYSASGVKKISLESQSSIGSIHAISKSTTVTSFFSPDINFTSQNICVNHDVNFTSQNSSGDIVTYDWDFGDTNSSILQDPTHQYTSAGEYQIELEVTAANGCKNIGQQNLTIYTEPLPDFTLPAIAPICTNQNFLFDNATTDVGYTPQWEWRINGSLITTNEDLSYTFTNTSNQEIKLKASIPGCENETIKNISSLVDGPTPDFSFVGQCEDADILFTNSSSGSITEYSWNFGDGQSSSNVNPNHTFSTIGSFDVTLTASNAAGCNNVASKQVMVYSKPQVNFAAALPPFSCNGTPTMFNDLTPNPVDSNIASWMWNFGDSGSGQNTSALKNPQHTYVTAGDYDVSLTVSTNFLCSSTLQLPVTISQSPQADFNFTPPCEDVVINFTDTSLGAIQSWNWEIGSTFYFIQNPAHTFSNPVSTNATLNVTATNSCISSITKPIIVPAKLIPDFSVSKNCNGQETLFTDITNTAADPVTNRDWNFNNLGTGTGSPETFTFTTTGNKNVTLTLTTQTGCTYEVTKAVNITSSPQANFTASPEAGAPPLEVQFTNTSVGATSYLWSFNDSESTTSNQVSPSFTYQDLGEYVVDLTSFNAQNCSHTFSRAINVVLPVVDLALIGLELMEFPDGSLKPAVTIYNHGNTPLSNLGLLVDVSGPVIREYVSTTILPGTSYRHVLEIGIPDPDQLDYLCIEADIEDISPQDNQACQNIEKTFITLPPYPNPTNGELHIDWILSEDGIVNVSVINSMGQAVEDFSVSSSEGLNPITLETAGMSSGVYLIRLDYKSTTRVYRVFVAE